MSRTYEVDELTYVQDLGLTFTCPECGDGRVDLHFAHCTLCGQDFDVEVRITTDGDADE